MSKKNLKPEKIVEKQVVKWCLDHGFWMHVVESKATYSRNLGRYLRGNAPEGFSDMVGITCDGIPCFIELKAKGKRSTASAEQIQFLIQAINRGAFAAVIDSPDRLEATFYAWRSSYRKALYLFSELPRKHVPLEILSIQG